MFKSLRTQTIYIPNSGIKPKLNVVRPPTPAPLVPPPPEPLSEINIYEPYKSALTHLLAHKDDYPNNVVVLHLYGDKPNNLAYIDRIYKLATEHGIIISELPTNVSTQSDSIDPMVNFQNVLTHNPRDHHNFYDSHKSYYSYNSCGGHYNYNSYKCDTNNFKFPKLEEPKPKFIPKIKHKYQDQCVPIYSLKLKEAFQTYKTCNDGIKLDKSIKKKLKNQVLHEFYTQLKLHNPEVFRIQRPKKQDPLIQEFINQMYLISTDSSTDSSEIHDHYQKWLIDHHPTRRIRTLISFCRILNITTINGKQITINSNGRSQCCRIVKKTTPPEGHHTSLSDPINLNVGIKVRVRRAKPDSNIEEFINQMYTISKDSTPSHDIYDDYKSWMQVNCPTSPVKSKIAFGAILRVVRLNGENMSKSSNGRQQAWKIIRKHI